MNLPAVSSGPTTAVTPSTSRAGPSVPAVVPLVGSPPVVANPAGSSPGSSPGAGSLLSQGSFAPLSPPDSSLVAGPPLPAVPDEGHPSDCLEPFVPLLDAIAARPIDPSSWSDVCAAVGSMTVSAQQTLSISIGDADAPPVRRRRTNPDDPRVLQGVYRRNRRMAMRAVLGSDSPFCDLPVATLHDYFLEARSPKTFDASLLEEVTAAETPPSSEPFTPGEVVSYSKV